MLVPIFYFGPLNYFSFLAKNTINDLIFETQENFPKQTFRNRCYIMGANGKLCLTIPIKHKSSTRNIKDTKISYDFDWKKQHLKSIESAYRSSPYYEYYEDSLIKLFKKDETFLVDLNIKTIQWALEKLDLETKLKLSTEYIEKQEEKDFRDSFSTKKEIIFDKNLLGNLTNYTQVFNEHHDFIRNLSILDLIFNCGPMSIKNLV